MSIFTVLYFLNIGFYSKVRVEEDNYTYKD